MMNRKQSLLIVIGLMLFAVVFSMGRAASQAATPPRGEACLAVSDGGGVVRLLWPVPRSGWPAGGWQIVDESGRVLKRVRAGEGPASAFSAEKTTLLKTVAKGLPVFPSSQERESFFLVLLADVVTDPAFARAAGFSAILEGLPAGPRSYRVIGVSADGKPSGLAFKSPVLDASVPTPPPAAPSAFKAESAREGVRLFWTKSAGSTAPEAYTFFVERKTEGADYIDAVGKPLLLSTNRKPEAPALIDDRAPLEKLIEYRIFGADAFGRRSVPAETSVFHIDQAALEPPADIKVTGGAGRNVLEWAASKNPRAGRIVVWRAHMPAGPYASLTPEGLPAGTSRYEDAAVKGGVSYFYRLQVLGASRREGPRSGVFSAAPKNAAPPARPEGLAADLERTRIRLSWKAAGEALLAGYIVERKDARGEWVRLNERIAGDTVFYDYGGSEGPAAWSYRVRSVALDNQESPASATVDVVVPDRSLPPVPEVLSGDGEGGKALVRFRPGQPAAKSAQFVVLRSDDPRDAGVVLGRPLPAEAREYIDPFVEAGAQYWYRVVALGADGNRSEPSEAVLVRIGLPSIPAPPAPKAELVLKPSPLVRVRFAPAPQGLEAVLERKLSGERDWVILSVVSRGGEAVDGNLPESGSIEYRIAYRTRSGAYGPASPAVTVQR